MIHKECVTANTWAPPALARRFTLHKGRCAFKCAFHPSSSFLPSEAYHFVSAVLSIRARPALFNRPHSPLQAFLPHRVSKPTWTSPRSPKYANPPISLKRVRHHSPLINAASRKLSLSELAMLRSTTKMSDKGKPYLQIAF